MAYTDARADNPKFFPATDTLDSLGVAVPKVFAHDPALRLAWVEDLGAESLWDAREESWDVREKLYKATLREVAKLHRTTPDDLSADRQAELMEPFDEELYLWEQSYFFDHLVSGMCGLPDAEVDRLRHDPALLGMAKELATEPRSLVHRDFQSQNVILVGEQRGPFLIDHQGLRWGLPEYDLASLIYDPYVKFPEGAREDLADYHFGLLGLNENNIEQGRRRLRLTTIQRLMQALGAYANLGRNLGKPRFFQHIPIALDLLLGVMAKEPELANLHAELVELRGEFGA